MNKEVINIKEIFGRKIRKYRELKGYTQEYLAEKKNIGISTLSNIECGKSFPTLENLNKFISVLEVAPQDLFTDESFNQQINALEDFDIRFNRIKNDKNKFEILYAVLKVLS